jgi:hypothetical protein
MVLIKYYAITVVLKDASLKTGAGSVPNSYQCETHTTEKVAKSPKLKCHTLSSVPCIIASHCYFKIYCQPQCLQSLQTNEITTLLAARSFKIRAYGLKIR